MKIHIGHFDRFVGTIEHWEERIDQKMSVDEIMDYYYYFETVVEQFWDVTELKFGWNRVAPIEEWVKAEEVRLHAEGVLALDCCIEDWTACNIPVSR